MQIVRLGISLTFVDSEFAAQLLKAQLPKVVGIGVPSDTPAQHELSLCGRGSAFD